jgi:hypothetical protein
VGISRKLAAFRLDKLVKVGLLRARYEPVDGKSDHEATFQVARHRGAERVLALVTAALARYGFEPDRITPRCCACATAPLTHWPARHRSWFAVPAIPFSPASSIPCGRPPSPLY